MRYGTSAFSFPTAGEPSGSTPEAFALRALYPNPARASVTATYTLDRPQEVGLELVDVLGRVVRSEAATFHPAGPHEVHLDLGGVRAGLYLLRLRGNGVEATRRFVVVR